MKYLIALLAYCMMTDCLSAQKTVVNEYAAIDKIVLQIPDSISHSTEGIARFIRANHTTDKEKLRAIFTWITNNIQYDVDNMFAINFYEQEQEKIEHALQNRKGICSNFAALFHVLCTKSGIQSYVITGYTKQNGFADYIPHAWCAAPVGNNWYMFDPTWGSGYIAGGKFYHKMNNAYFMVPPELLIKSHMPFDFMWQFLNYPVSNQEFYENKTAADKSKPFFNYIDSIRAYEIQDSTGKLLATAARIERNGIKNAMIFDQLQHIKLQLENNRQRNVADTYNNSIGYYNAAINNLNIFIDYRNKQFNPEKPDTAILAMIETASVNLQKARDKLKTIEQEAGNNALVIIQQQKAVDNMAVHIKEQRDWLNIYFSKSKSKRKAMFYEKKTTLFGIPLN
jgi:transglutaminase/protease-like cytokinesis protein 3